MTAETIGTDTNYFQRPAPGLSPPRGLRADIDSDFIQHLSGNPAVYLSWETSYAGRGAISRYEVSRGGNKVGEVKHKPQTTHKPFTFRDAEAEVGPNEYSVRAVDAEGARSAPAEASVECTAGM
jgi:hypothetical protein